MHCTETCYYKSPLGILRIETKNNHLTGLFYTGLTQIPEQNPINTTLANSVCTQLTEWFNGKRFIFNLPIDPEGTDFQKKVWAELQHIPYGKTISYIQLAKNLNNPLAVRAVGAANGKNPINIIIPCHRVIGKNGSMVGYGGEIWRKKELIIFEQKNSGLTLNF